MATTKRPRPPKRIAGDALAEWNRVCAELSADDRLATTDRALITLYVETWTVWAAAMQHVNEFGAIVKMHNGFAGRSPFYTVVKETAAQLRGLIADLGLTPTKRDGRAAPADDDDAPELDI